MTWVVSRYQTSVRAGTAVLDRLAPLRDLVLYELTEIDGRHAVLAHEIDAERLELLANLRRLHRLDSRGVEFLYDCVRGSVRQGGRVPRIGRNVNAAFLRGREVGQVLDPLRRERGDRLHGLALDLRERGRNDLGHVIDPAAPQILHRGRAATVGNVRHVDAERGVEQHRAQMHRCPDAGRGKRHLLLVLLGVVGEFLDVADGQIVAHDQHQRDVREQRHRLEVLAGIIERLLRQVLHLRLRADSAEQDHVAIRRRGLDAVRAGHAARAGRVLDYDLLAESLAHPGGDHTAEHVRRAAGRERNDHRDRTGGVVLRERRCAEREYGRERGDRLPEHHVLREPVWPLLYRVRAGGQGIVAATIVAAYDRHAGHEEQAMQIGIAGLGTIGRVLARNLADGVPGLPLACVAARDAEKARGWLDEEGIEVPIVPFAEFSQHAGRAG